MLRRLVLHPSFHTVCLNFARLVQPAWKANFRLVQRPRSDSIRHMFPEGFQTQRLLLRPIGLADARPIFDSYAQDPEVSRYLTWRPHTAIEQTETYVNACLAATTYQTYVLAWRTNNMVIGAFDVRQSGPTRLGYGYVLARAFWGRGLMTEALAEVVDWALRQPSIWRIGDVCDVENIASARVMEKAGLECEGVLRRWSVHPNLGDAPRNCLSYAKVR
jgi:[ribosomal protein S5]-alanine N-acetyltransferase